LKQSNKIEIISTPEAFVQCWKRQYNHGENRFASTDCRQ